MKEPNFLIGGTAAAGTSFLSAILVQHPEIFLPKEMRPEPHYFYKTWEYNKGKDYYLNRWFQNVPKAAIAIGERSSSYFFGGRDVAKKIAKEYPNMKFIFTMRNPVERTWANYRYTALQGLEDLEFEEALAQEQSRIKEQSGEWKEIQPHNYTGRGFYAAQLKEYLNYFPKENILCIKSELLSSQTNVELQRIYSFLELSLTNSKYEKAANHTALSVVSPRLQMDLRHYFTDRFDQIIEAIRTERDVTHFILNDSDSDKIKLLLNNLITTKQPIPVAAKNYLNDIFFDDLNELTSLVDFNILDWKKC